MSKSGTADGHRRRKSRDHWRTGTTTEITPESTENGESGTGLWGGPTADSGQKRRNRRQSEEAPSAGRVSVRCACEAQSDGFAEAWLRPDANARSSADEACQLRWLSQTGRQRKIYHLLCHIVFKERNLVYENVYKKCRQEVTHQRQCKSQLCRSAWHAVRLSWSRSEVIHRLQWISSTELYFVPLIKPENLYLILKYLINIKKIWL